MRGSLPFDVLPFLDALAEIIAVFDADGTLLYANPAAARILGVEPDSSDGPAFNVWRRFPGAVGGTFHQAFQRVAETGETAVFDAPAQHLPGLWFRNRIYRVAGRIHVVASDVSKEKHAELRLRVLSEAADALARAHTLDAMSTAIARTLTETLGDGCTVRLVDETTRMSRLAASHHRRPNGREALARVNETPISVDEGLALRCYGEGRPVLVRHVEPGAHAARFTDPERRRFVDALDVGSIMAVPLRDGKKRVGIVGVIRDRGSRALDENDLDLLVDVAARASGAIERARLFEETERSKRRAAMIANAAHAFVDAPRERDAILALLARIAGDAIGDLVAATALSDDGAHLERISIHHRDPDVVAAVNTTFSAREPVAGTLSGAAIASLRARRLSPGEVDALFRPELRANVDATLERYRPTAILVAPIELGGRAIGAVTLSRIDGGPAYSDDDEALLLELCRRASLAIENARVIEAERSARRAAEQSAALTSRLLSLSSRLSQRMPKRDISDAVLSESVRALGGCTAAIWVLASPSTQSSSSSSSSSSSGMEPELELVAHVGYREAEGFARFRVTPGIPLADAVLAKKPVYLASRADYVARYPHFDRRLTEVAPADFATACLPLVAEGKVVGALAYVLERPHDFTAEERTFLEVLAHQCAQALDRAALLEQERDANRTLNAIVASSSAAITVLDLDGTVRLWNPAAETMFGYGAHEMIGGTPFPNDERARAELAANLARVGRGERIEAVEIRRMRRDGTVIDCALWAVPLAKPDGTVQCLSVVIDITDRKRAEQAALEADRRKDDFLAMLGHELRNPLAPILTALQLMKLRGVAGGMRERDIIERQTVHLVRLVDDLLDLSRVTRGLLELRRGRTDLADVIARAVETASPLFEQRRHALKIDVQRHAHYVDGDEQRLAQVFQNLLVNAARYTPAGGAVTVRLRGDDERVVVEVSDNGCGIAPALLPLIFDPFVQGERSIDRAEGGLGLGLALVRRIVDLHEGSVSAHSEGPGHGSTFVVVLPRAGPAPRIVEETSSEVRLREARRRKVLVVDDNEDAAEMLAELLRTDGHDVLVAHDGPSALSGAPRFQPDVAFLDIGLPVMDGYELASKLRDVTSPVHLVAVTGYGQDHDRQKSAQAGFVDHLVKPVDVTRVLAVARGSTPTTRALS